MNNKDLIFNIGIVVMIIAIIALIAFKFIANEKANSFTIDNENLVVSDLLGTKVKFTDIISFDKISYCFFFDMNDCHSCILKGLDDLVILKKSGEIGFAFAIHHRVDEVEGWSRNYNCSPLYVIQKNDFYENIHTQLTPVIVKINNGKVISSRYILP